MIVINLVTVTPKAAAKLELLINKLASGYGYTEAGLLNNSSSLAPTLGVTKFIIVKGMILVLQCCATKVWL